MLGVSNFICHMGGSKKKEVEDLRFSISTGVKGSGEGDRSVTSSSGGKRKKAVEKDKNWHAQPSHMVRTRDHVKSRDCMSQKKKEKRKDEVKLCAMRQQKRKGNVHWNGGPTQSELRTTSFGKKG